MVGTDPRHVGRAQVMRGRASQAKFSGIPEEKRRGGERRGREGRGRDGRRKEKKREEEGSHLKVLNSKLQEKHCFRPNIPAE